LWFDVNETPGRQSIIVPLTQEDKQRIAAKNEAAQQASLENQKHQHAMQQIEEKGISQAGTKVIENLAAHAHPDAMFPDAAASPAPGDSE
jgi:hypothetical protein